MSFMWEKAVNKQDCEEHAELQRKSNRKAYRKKHSLRVDK